MRKCEKTINRFIEVFYKYKQDKPLKIIAIESKIDRTTLSRKLHKKSDFTINEVFKIGDVLKFKNDDYSYIFKV